MEFQSKATVLTVSSDVKTKTNGGKFVKCTVQHLDGPLAGKKFFANRTILSINQETGEPIEKANVSVGDEVTCYNRVAENRDGQNTIYSEISIQSQVDSLDDIMATLGESVDAQAQSALAGNN